MQVVHDKDRYENDPNEPYTVILTTGCTLLAAGEPADVWRRVVRGEGILAAPENKQEEMVWLNPDHVLLVRDAAYRFSGTVMRMPDGESEKLYVPTAGWMKT